MKKHVMVVTKTNYVTRVVPSSKVLPANHVMSCSLLCIVAPDSTRLCFGVNLDFSVFPFAKSLKLSPLGSELGLGLGSENHAIRVAAST